MASTFTDLLRLEKQASGENDSTWGDRANTVFEMIEDAIANLKGVVMPADANYVLTTANSSTDEARCMGLSVTSGVPLTATRDVTCPTSTKSYLVKNLTTGGQSIRIKTAAGTGITIPNGKTSFVLCDGTNVVSAIDWLSSLSLGTPLALADGGTSATSASAARTALGLVIGTDIEAHDADLTAIAGLGGTGIAVRTAANTWAQRQLVAPAAGISITNPDGVSGNPTFALANDLAAVEALSTTGLVARTGSETYSPRTLTGPAAGITVTNGGGVAGDPTLALANDLSALEGLGSTGFAVRTGADTWAQRSLSAGAGISITNPDGVGGNPSIAATATPADVQIFTGNGTWTKPANAKACYCVVISAGGGGGGGLGGNAGTSRAGGAAGGAGSLATLMLQASALGASETITVGTAGTSGPGGSGGVGTAGGAGGTSSIGTKIVVTGGAGGGGGGAGSGNTSNAGIGQFVGGTGGKGGDGLIDLAGASGSGSYTAAGGGGGGGSITSGNAEQVGGAGGATQNSGNGGTAGAVNGGAGGAGANGVDVILGSGGGGGGGQDSGTGGVGGNGGTLGGGGGGGGAGTTTGGAGGTGGRGEVRIFTFF